MSAPGANGERGRRTATAREAPRRQRLRVDWARCTGHLVCAGLLPEFVEVDDWGYPIIRERAVPPALLRHARRARAGCPALALRLECIARPASNADDPDR